MQQYQRAVEAIREPSRADKLKRELAQASVDDLKKLLERTSNKSKRRRVAAAIKKREP